MAKQHLSDANCRKLARLMGIRIVAAYTRGGWPHGSAEVWPLDQDGPIYVDRKTGKEMKDHPWYRELTAAGATVGVEET